MYNGRWELYSATGCKKIIEERMDRLRGKQNDTRATEWKTVACQNGESRDRMMMM